MEKLEKDAPAIDGERRAASRGTCLAETTAADRVTTPDAERCDGLGTAPITALDHFVGQLPMHRATSR